MELIAERAGVAVQTVYFAFRTKDDLLRAVHEWTVLGDDPTPPQLQDWHAAAMAEPLRLEAPRLGPLGQCHLCHDLFADPGA